MSLENNFAEYLSEQARSPTAAIHEFRLLYEANTVHVFFEGDEDVLYYLPEIRRRARKRGLCSYLCGGKWGVVEVREFMRTQNYDDALCLYFIDRDYDDLFGCQPAADVTTYLTDDYSIENSIVCLDSVEIVLVDLANLSKADSRYKAIRASFPSAHSHFVRRIDPLLAWSVALREAGGKPNYNNINLKNVFSVQSDGGVSRTIDGFEAFRRAVTSKQVTVGLREVIKWLRVFRGLPIKQRIRGKYELWFFETFLTIAITAANKGTKKKTPTALQNRSLFEALGARVEKPDSLNSFLDKVMA